MCFCRHLLASNHGEGNGTLLQLLRSIVVLTPLSPLMYRDTLSKAITPTTFFAGGDAGIIVFADDMKHCHDVQQLSTAIDAELAK